MWRALTDSPTASSSPCDPYHRARLGEASGGRRITRHRIRWSRLGSLAFQDDLCPIAPCERPAWPVENGRGVHDATEVQERGFLSSVMRSSWAVHTAALPMWASCKPPRDVPGWRRQRVGDSGQRPRTRSGRLPNRPRRTGSGSPPAACIDEAVIRDASASARPDLELKTV